MNKILNILCLTLLINTNVYASGVINFLENSISELHSDNTKTNFDLRYVMKYASFSHENNNNNVAKYNRILFFIDKQYKLSILNFKLNNKLQLDESEINLKSMMNNIETNGEQIQMSNMTYCSDDYKLIKYYESKPYDINFDLYYDVREILKNNKVTNFVDQLKLDIYKQIQDMKNNSTQYDSEFKVLHMYFINQFYKELLLDYINNNSILKHISSKIYPNNNDSSYDMDAIEALVSKKIVYTHRNSSSCNCVEYLIEKYGRPPEDEPNLLPRHINGIPIYLKRSSSKYDDGFKILHEHFMHSYGYK